MGGGDWGKHGLGFEFGGRDRNGQMGREGKGGSLKSFERENPMAL